MRTYVILALALCAFGFLAIFSVGAPFFLTGIAMLVLAPWRHRGSVLATALLGVWVFVAAYVLVAPLSCTSEARAEVGSVAVARTSCSSILGIDYSGGGSYNPPLLPALLVGLVVGCVAAIATRWVLQRHSVEP